MIQKLAVSTYFLSLVMGAAAQSPRTVSTISPDGRIRLQLSAPGGALGYSVTAAGHPVLLQSAVGIESDNVELGEGVSLGKPQRRKLHETYTFHGAHSTATIDANEVTVPAQSHGQSFLVDVHVANDGVAVRLRLPAETGRTIQADRSTWALPGDPTMWIDKLTAFYESPYHTSTLSRLETGEGGNLGFPITARLNGGLYATLTEAEVHDYGDLTVYPGPDHVLHGELYADPKGWTTDDAVLQPWRVTVIARNLNELVNTTLVQNLNPPPTPELANATWIQPGRSSWQWLCCDAPVQKDQMQWVDWTAQLGFEYYLIDEGWADWKSDPWGTVEKVVPYARSKNVKIWIWVDSSKVMEPAERRAYFQKAAEAGVVGVKIDFPPPSSRRVSNWYYEAAADAAADHLMVDFHGATKPTGIERTWPNVLTREGVRGHEYQITRYHRVPQPDHDVILPFTRYIAGPGDYTPTVFKTSELMGNTWAHELAQSVILTSPFLCFGEAPETYLANPALDVLKAVSPVWDETRVLSGSEPGVVVAEARRVGDRWLVAVINGGQATDLTVSFDFLGKEVWKSTLLRDSAAKPDAFDREDGTADSKTEVKLHLQPRGGFVAWLRR